MLLPNQPCGVDCNLTLIVRSDVPRETDIDQVLPTATTSARMPHRRGRIVLATASASIWFSRDFVNSSGRGLAGLRLDTTFSAERAQAAADREGCRFGTDTILGFAVG